MQRISKKQQSLYRRVVSDIRRDASTHRLPPDHDIATDQLDGAAITADQDGLWIRTLLPSFHVGKIEFEARITGPCKRFVEESHERRIHAGAGSVRENHRQLFGLIRSQENPSAVLIRRLPYERLFLQNLQNLLDHATVIL